MNIQLPSWLENIVVWPVLLYRYCQFGYTFRRIYLGEGFWTILEQEDFYRLRNFKWVAYKSRNSFYAVRLKIIGVKVTKMLSMHREIMNEPAGLLVDHRNCDSLDNRRANLRFATHAENMRNRRKLKNTSSCFIGVYLDKPRNRWCVHIRRNGKKLFIGRFKNEIDAAKAYDEAAKKYHVEFARLNFPPESEESRALFARIGKSWAKLLGSRQRNAGICAALRQAGGIL
jgi:hypothetical protein